MAAVGGSLALTCVAPFAAFAVDTAGTLRLGSGDVFAPALLGRLALIDAAWLGGLTLVHAALDTWVQPWRGVTSRLARVP